MLNAFTAYAANISLLGLKIMEVEMFEKLTQLGEGGPDGSGDPGGSNPKPPR